MPNPLQLTLFGSPEVYLHGQPVTGFRSSKAQALLYYLAVTGRPHTRATLAGLLWGDQPETAARASLSKCLSNLRDLVGDAVLVDRQTVVFNRDHPYQLDTEHFLTNVNQPPTPETIQSRQAALARYRGDFLEGFYVREAPDFEQWVLVQRTLYREAVMQGLHTLANYTDQQGDLAQAITHTRRLLTLEPWHEEAHRQLMTRLARNGQRSAALAQYVVCCQVLNEELAVEPDQETVALYEQIRDDKTSPSKATRQGEVKANLPLPDSHSVTLSEPLFSVPAVATPLIGRGRELAELGELLTNPDCRLITLFGPGGIGKTRLALAAGAERVMTARFPQGAAFVALAGVTSAQFLPTAILGALAVELKSAQSAQQQLLAWLRPRHLLLVLDNYEQLLPDVTLLIEILQSAPGVTLLVTSRERLQLQAEWLLTLTGLDYPRHNHRPPGATQGEEFVGSEHSYPALDLFLQRIRQLRHQFAPDAVERQAILQICQLTEGIPLALELAAGAARLHTCAQIAADLAHGQPLATLPMRDRPARQQTIDATFDYSWRLLNEQEQQVLRQLALFRGGFEYAAAQQVAGATLSLLADLINKSLLHQSDWSLGAGRYTMQELVRQYATKKLQEAGEEQATRHHHADYFLTLAETGAVHVRGPDQKSWLTRLQAEQDNLRAALTNLMEDDAQRALRLAVALGPFWRRWGQDKEGRTWLALIRRQSQPTWPGYATALMWDGSLARRLQKREEALALLQESLRLFQTQQDQDGMAQTLRHLGWAYYGRDIERAIHYFEESLAIFRQLQNKQRIAQVLVDLSQLQIESANYPLATDYLQESLALNQEIGDLHTQTLALMLLADLCELEGQYDEAAKLYSEACTIYQTLEMQPMVAATLFALSENSWHRGQYAEARRYAEQSCRLHQRTGGRPVIALHHLALAEYSLGELARAQRHFGEALQLNAVDDRTRMIARCLAGLGAVAGQQQNWQRSVRLFAAADALFTNLPPFLAPIAQRWVEEQIETTQAHCDETFFANHWRIGAAMPLAQVVAYALADLE